MMNKNEICSKCKFWTVEDEEHGAWGTCQRYPDNKSKFPRDWCGEWQAREEEEPPDVKVEVSRKELEGWIDEIQHVEGYHTGGIHKHLREIQLSIWKALDDAS